ncbi:MAG: hypothetical protein M3R58_01210 [Pseudomonadota bacterium]|nr:hypothetical protein [Pseudomonadota bacterium]
MDIVSHGLWAGVAAAAIRRKRPVTRGQVAATVLLGVLPDIGQLIPVVVWSFTQGHPVDLVYAFITATPANEPAISPMVQTLSHHLHCAMHSVVVLSVVSLVAWRLWPWLLVPLVGWWLHIALDIPTHSNDYYAVPFLYPLTYWGVDGISWTTPWLLAVNYVALAAAYAAFYFTRRRPPGPRPASAHPAD